MRPRPRCPEFQTWTSGNACQTRGPQGLQRRASDPVSMARGPAPVSGRPRGTRQPGVVDGPRGAARVTYLGGHGAARGPELQTDRQRGPESGRHRWAGCQPLAPLSVRPAPLPPRLRLESGAGARPETGRGGPGADTPPCLLLHPPAPPPCTTARTLTGVRPPRLWVRTSSVSHSRPPRPCNLLLTSPPIRIKLPRGGAGNPQGGQAPTKLVVAPRLLPADLPSSTYPSHPRQALPLVEERGKFGENIAPN